MENNDQKLHPLCISFWAPPVVRPQAILLGKMLPEWIRQGVNPVLVTYKNRKKWKINIPQYFIPPFKIGFLLSKFKLNTAFAEKLYYEFLYFKTKRIIKKHNINLVFSFSCPIGSNILGAMIRKRLGIKFVAHFSDPLYDNFYKNYSEDEKRKVLKTEEFILNNSDRIVFTNNNACELFIGRYPGFPKNKIDFVPHCYKKNDYNLIKIEKGNEQNKFVFCYIGVFYKNRNPEFFFQAIADVFKDNPELIGLSKIRIIGAENNYADFKKKDIEQLIKKYNLKDVAESLPEIEYLSSLQHMKNSDCLVSIDSDIQNSPFLPSKIIDYIGSGTLVLAITPDNSPVAKLLKPIGYRCFNYQALHDLSAYLRYLIVNKEDKGMAVDWETIKMYEVENTTKKLISIFKQVWQQI